MAIPNLFTSATVPNIVQLVVYATYGAQQIRNIYHAVVDNKPTNWASASGIDTLYNAARLLWEDVVVPFHRPFAHNSMNFYGVQAIAPDEDQVAYWKTGVESTWSDSINGFNSGDGMTPFDAFSIRLKPISSGLVGVGYKRLAGVPESRQNGGLIATSPDMDAALADFEDFATGIQNVTIPGSGAFDMALIIPKQELVMIDGVPRYKTVGGYRINDVTLRGAITSQNTRKRGVGI